MDSYSKRARTGFGNPFFGARAGGRAGVGTMRGNFYAGARAGAAGRYRVRRRLAPIVPGYTRRVGNYGRFGTGRGRYSQIELKKHDLALTLGPTASAGVASVSPATGNLTCNIPQGMDATGNRIGRKIIVKSIQLKLGFVLAAGATPSDSFFVYLIQDTQCNGALPVAADFFVATGGMGVQLRNLDNGRRFKVLKKFVADLQSDAGVAGAYDGAIQHQECYIKCNIPIEYGGTTGVITEVKTNNLFMVYGSPNGISVCSGNARIRFTDL